MNFGVIIVIAIIAVKIWEFISKAKEKNDDVLGDFSGRPVSEVPTHNVDDVIRRLEELRNEDAKKRENQLAKQNVSSQQKKKKTQLTSDLESAKGAKQKSNKSFLSTSEGERTIRAENREQSLKSNTEEFPTIDLEVDNIEEVRRAFIYSEIFQRKY